VQFVHDVLAGGLGVRQVVVGQDFRFGNRRAGDVEMLAAVGKDYGFGVSRVETVAWEREVCSSSRVRAAIAAGDVALARDLLAHPFMVEGRVIVGDRRGRELGYPTANLRLDPSCGLRHGIYAVRVGIGSERYAGVASFGRRPMFDVGTVLLEVFLFHFSGDLYGQTIDVAFIDWIRHELKLDTIEELIRRMDEDSRLARIALGRSGDAFPPLGEVEA
jgi:riboflavin kinase / FMN adenylyltransferase